MVRMISREDILGTKLAVEPVPVPEWGGTVYVREMTGAERDAWESTMIQSRENARAVTLVRCIVNEAGERLFRDEDAEALGAKSGRILARIADVARRLNKLGGDDLEDAKGNSEPDRSDDSVSS